MGNFSNGKYKAFGDEKVKIKGTYYKSFDPAKGGNLGGGTWWDDSRDTPIFNDQMPVFQIENKYSKETENGLKHTKIS